MDIAKMQVDEIRVIQGRISSLTMKNLAAVYNRILFSDQSHRPPGF